MKDSISDRVQLDELAEEFTQRRRRGETPSLTEYAERFPHLAQEIRELFPALDLLEQYKPAVGELTVDEAGAKPARPALNLDQLGDYRILREIGRGGMGVVYEAEQLSLGRRVAIKVLPGRTLGDTSLGRFLREARAAAGLHHSNIVPVFGVGEDQGLHYYVMQYIVGLGMDQVLEELRRMEGREAFAKNPTQGLASGTAWLMAQSLVSGTKTMTPIELPPSTVRPAAAPDEASATALSTSMSVNTETRNVYWQSVARIGKQVADALAYAHAKGIVHRDIKPSNLILDDKGTVWVTDFGLAKATASDEHLTHAGDIVGTLRYMAPERFQGKSDIRGDVFSLGITLYEMLTLQAAYQAGDRESLLELIRSADPPRPRKIRSGIPRDLETIVLKAIDRDPNRRYQTGAELADDLQRFLEDRPIRARRVTSTEHVWLWSKRNPLLATLMGFVAVLLITMTIGATVMNVLLREERNTARSNEDRAVKAEKKIQHERDQTLEHLGKAYLAQARALRLARQPGFRNQGLDAVRKAAAIGTSLELRNEAAALLLTPDVSVLREWDNRIDGFTWIGTHPDARTYALSDMKGDVSIRSMDDRKELVLLSWPGPHATVAHFSVSGRYVGVKYHDDFSLRFALWDVEKKERIWEHAGGFPQAVAISADDRWLALTTDSRQANQQWVLYDIVGKAVVKTLPTAPVAFAFDSVSKVLAVHQPGGLEIRRVPSLATEKQLLRKTPMAAGLLRWIPDTQQLAVCVGPKIFVHDMADTKSKPMLLQGHESRINGMIVSHGGDWLLASADDGGARIWDLTTGRCEVTASGHVMGISQDDRRIAFGAGNRLGIWEFHAVPECRRLPVGTANFEGGLSKDGRWYANNGPKGMEIYEVATGKLAASLPIPAPRGIQLTPDGRYILASNFKGCSRWPIRLEGPTGLTLGEPELLFERPAHHCGGVLSPDGKHLAFIGAADTVLWHDLEKRQNVFTLQDHQRVASVAISPDGLWLATGTWQGTRVLVRDTRTGELAAEVAAPMSAHPLFSPCGKWLLTCNPDDFRLWNVPSFKLVRSFPRKSHGNWAGGAAFSRDSRILALDTTPHLIQLFDPATGSEYMSLETAPRKVSAFLHGFTPNADALVGGGAGQFRCCWDLKAIRAQLREMKLDWDEMPKQTE